MGIVGRATAVAVVLAVVAAVTAILWLFRSSTVGPQHPVFFLSVADGGGRHVLR